MFHSMHFCYSKVKSEVINNTAIFKIAYIQASNSSKIIVLPETRLTVNVINGVANPCFKIKG